MLAVRRFGAACARAAILLSAGQSVLAHGDFSVRILKTKPVAGFRILSVARFSHAAMMRFPVTAMAAGRVVVRARKFLFNRGGRSSPKRQARASYALPLLIEDLAVAMFGCAVKSGSAALRRVQAWLARAMVRASVRTINAERSLRNFLLSTWNGRRCGNFERFVYGFDHGAIRRVTDKRLDFRDIHIRSH